MERVAQLVVHMEEALRLSVRDDVPSLRVALLLFDSAAELMLHRECEWRLSWERNDRARIENLERLQADGRHWGEHLAAELAAARDRVTSRRKVRDIERYFDAKVAFVETFDLVPAAELRALRKLHHYRNDAYHRDYVRPKSVAAAVAIYRHIACLLMRDLPVYTMIGTWGSAGPPALTRHVDGPIGIDVQSRIAQGWIDTLAPDDAIASALSDHLLDRLHQVDECLEYAAATYRESTGDLCWSAAAVLHHLQMEDGWTSAFITATRAKAARVPVTMKRLTTWRREARSIGRVDQAVLAFDQFAALEEQIEPIERAALDLSHAIDEGINRGVERMRGG